MRQGFGMHISAIGDGDIAFGKGHAAEAFGALLIGYFDKAEAFGWEVEGAMQAP
jgi:hypothetical protein